MKTETLTWHELPQDGMPDAEITVQVEVRDPEGSGTECWPAFWGGERWIDAATGMPIDGDRVNDSETLDHGVYAGGDLMVLPTASVRLILARSSAFGQNRNTVRSRSVTLAVTGSL